MQPILVTPVVARKDAGPLGARDRDLQLARRADWRFLLPDPRLRRVAYLGPGKDSLIEALGRLSEALTVLPLREGGESLAVVSKGFDLLVVQCCGGASVRAVISGLRRGGHLYWELPSQRFPGQPRRQASWLHKLGFTDVQRFWHRPDFEQCKEIIPLNSSSVRFVASRLGEGTLGRVTAAASGLMTAFGLFPWFVSSQSILARRS